MNDYISKNKNRKNLNIDFSQQCGQKKMYKTKHRTKKTHELKNLFQNIAFFLAKWLKFSILNDHISKTKITQIGKLIFHLLQNIAQRFFGKKKTSYFYGGRGGGLHVVNMDRA